MIKKRRILGNVTLGLPMVQRSAMTRFKVSKLTPPEAVAAGPPKRCDCDGEARDADRPAAKDCDEEDIDEGCPVSEITQKP